VARIVNCIKLGRELPGLDYPPFGGPLGVKVWQQVSDEAWKGFTEHFKRILNENQLVGGSEETTRAFLAEADRYFFGEGPQAAPANYKPAE
jgi:Fe-S cluster biosynthesis and repair protein YggX